MAGGRTRPCRPSSRLCSSQFARHYAVGPDIVTLQCARRYELDYKARWKFWRVSGVCDNKVYMETHADHGTVSHLCLWHSPRTHSQTTAYTSLAHPTHTPRTAHAQPHLSTDARLRTASRLNSNGLVRTVDIPDCVCPSVGELQAAGAWLSENVRGHVGGQARRTQVAAAVLAQPRSQLCSQAGKSRVTCTHTYIPNTLACLACTTELTACPCARI